jgi:UDP-3-O-[3-hydroxymyristoyl] N-acetylglucosamine deacetylase
LRLRKQRTLKNSIRCAGIGLHCERRVELVLKPAKPGSGIVFRRTDAESPNQGLPALWKNARVSGAQLLSAAAAAGVDNLTIELKGPEVPILDGSAEPFLFLLSCAGTVEQDAPAKALKIVAPVEVRNSEAYARLEPHDGFAIDIEVDYPHPALGHQQWAGEITIDRYQSEIARARAFEFRTETEGSPGDQPSSGGTMDHALVIGRDGVLNAGGFRYSDEPVRHTVLSAIGDLHMAGGPIIGRFRGRGCDHALVLRLLRELFATPQAWEWVGGPRSEA